eukprot:SAG11_NODE_1053_length_6020_cov_14.078027_2_plen_140_part_00
MKGGIKSSGSNTGGSPAAADVVTVPVSAPSSGRSSTVTATKDNVLLTPERPPSAVIRADAGKTRLASESEPPSVTAMDASCNCCTQDMGSQQSVTSNEQERAREREQRESKERRERAKSKERESEERRERAKSKERESE